MNNNVEYEVVEYDITYDYFYDGGGINDTNLMSPMSLMSTRWKACAIFIYKSHYQRNLVRKLTGSMQIRRTTVQSIKNGKCCWRIFNRGKPKYLVQPGEIWDRIRLTGKSYFKLLSEGRCKG